MHLEGDVDRVAPLLVHELRLLRGAAQLLHNLGVIAVVWNEDGVVNVFSATNLTRDANANALLMEEAIWQMLAKIVSSIQALPTHSL